MKSFKRFPWLIMLVSIKLFSQDKFTAADFYPKADSIALEFKSAVYCADIISDAVDTTGKSYYWTFKYDSLNIYFSLDSIYIEESNLYDYTGWGTVGNRWIDSDSAISVAEINGGKDFRNKHPDATISARLFGDSASPFPFWAIEYSSQSSPNEIVKITLNGNDGSIFPPMDVYSRHTFRPQNISLNQNYPNPFNSTTSISYNLDKLDHVTVSIYNISGQHLVTLVNGFKPPGSNKVIWQAQNYPTGIYLYRLQTSELMTTKKLILQR